ncbi:MAG: stage 0 sporulation protein [Desulfobacterales bacterium]|nr:stage 0 sporulation protein [Desulfobacterales bacterium]
MGVTVGVKFKAEGKTYFFDGGELELKKGDKVIVETEEGVSIGMISRTSIPHEEITMPLKKVVRIAIEEDIKLKDSNIEKEVYAKKFCIEKIQEAGLKMNLFYVESALDGTKLTFYFTAEGRIDFRNLVKQLVKEFRVRIEMRQVGIRNKARMCGGIGRCGRTICCSSYIDKFDPVSIKMAKEQGLSLNPTKISGLCGRLMCCLNFENYTYQNIKENMPKIGTTIITEKLKGVVIRHNVVSNRICIKTEDDKEIEIEIDDIIGEEE